jgi:hypothetical protein
MKKVKIMLSAIAIFAVVGGALAFKAKTNNTFYKKNTVNGKCDIPVLSQSTITTDEVNGIFFETMTLTQSSDCGILLTNSN